MPKTGKAKVLSEAEFDRVIKLQKYKRHSYRNIALLYFSFGLGLRAKELAALKVKDVVNTVGSLKEVINLTPNHTKGGKQRHVYLSNKAVGKVLQNYLAQHQNPVPKQALFMSQKGGHFSPNSMQMLISGIYRDAGIEGASSHSGRRSFATRLIEKGADIKAVSSLMGHSSIAMTAEYVEDNPNRLSKLTTLAI